MKWIMIVVICFTAEVCERMYDQEMYNTAEECTAASEGVAEYMKEASFITNEVQYDKDINMIIYILT